MSDFISVDTGGWDSMDVNDLYQRFALVSGAMEAVKDGANTMKRGMVGVSRAFGRCAKAAAGLLSTMMQTSTVSHGLEKGMMNLYHYARRNNRLIANGLDRMATSALYLRNSLAAMAAPLVRTVAPAVDAIADRFVEMFNTVNQLFARLAGASTYTAARRFGDSWERESGRITGALSAVRRYVMGFDEINIMGFGSGGDGFGGGDYDLMFEERRIEGGIAGFADRLREAFESGDWVRLGSVLGERINEAIDGIDWTALGGKIGSWLNGAIVTARSLLETVHFDELGARIAELMNGALSQIDFASLGAAVALFFTSAVETFAGFVKTFDWGQFAAKAAEAVNGFASTLGARLDAIDWAALAKKLVGGLNDFIRGVDWVKLGDTFAGRINDLLAILKTASAEFDWAGAGKALGESLSAMLQGVDWAALGDWLGNTLSGLLDFGIAFLENLDVDALCEGIKTALGRVDWDGVAAKLWKLFSLALEKLGGAAQTLLFGGETEVNVGVGLFKNGWTSIAGFVGTAVRVLTSLGKDGWTSIGGFVGTAVKVLTSLGKDGWTSIGGFVGTAVKVLTSLGKDGWTSVAAFVGTAVTVLTSLMKSDSQKDLTVKDLFGGDFSAAAKLNATAGKGLNMGEDNKFSLAGAVTGAVSLAAKVGSGLKTGTGGAWSLSKVVSGGVKLGATASKTFEVSGAVLKLKNSVSGVASLAAKAGAGLTGSKAKFSLSDAVSGFASLAAKAGKGLRTGDKGLELKDNINATAVADLVKSTGWASAVGGALEVLGLLGLSTEVFTSMLKQWGSNDPLDVLGLTALAAVVRITMDLVGKVGKAILQALGLSGNGDNTGANPPTLTMQVALAKDPKSLWNSFKTAWDAQKPTLSVSVGLDKTNVLNGVSSLNYRAPAMASGSVMPYDVSAQLAKSTADLQGTLDANNEDLIQTIISVAGQIVAAVGRLNPQPVPAGGMSTQEIINELNKRTQMYGSNPLKGV